MKTWRLTYTISGEPRALTVTAPNRALAAQRAVNALLARNEGRSDEGSSRLAMVRGVR